MEIYNETLKNMKNIKLFETFDKINEDSNKAKNLYDEIYKKFINYPDVLLNALTLSGISSEQYTDDNTDPTEDEIKSAYKFFRNDLIKIWSEYVDTFNKIQNLKK